MAPSKLASRGWVRGAAAGSVGRRLCALCSAAAGGKMRKPLANGPVAHPSPSLPTNSKSSRKTSAGVWAAAPSSAMFHETCKGAMRPLWLRFST